MFDQLETLGIVALAALLGGIVGLERELSGKPAGLRTHMFVTAGSCLFVLASVRLSNHYGQVMPDGMEVDPVRVLQAIIIGVSFIGTGTIIQRRNEEVVKNLTTAASLFFSTGIGVIVALEAWYLAVGLVLLAWFINYVINIVELRFIAPRSLKARQKLEAALKMKQPVQPTVSGEPRSGPPLHPSSHPGIS